VNKIVYENGALPTTGQMVFLYQTGSTPINLYHDVNGNISGAIVPSTTKTLQGGQFTLLFLTVTTWSVFS